jgi:hypothetical protein
VERTADEHLEMAECCLSLIEEGVVSLRQAQHVRRLLKQAEARGGATDACDDLRKRLAVLER